MTPQPKLVVARRWGPGKAGAAGRFNAPALNDKERRLS